jgi:hypothetical protein
MAVRTQEQNLDSLLDTMANVVGILVVLVAVTQLSVGDAVERIREQQRARPPATEEDVVAARARAESIASAITQTEGELEAFAPTERRRGLLLDEMRRHIEELEAMEGRHAFADLSAQALDAQVAAAHRTTESLSAEVAAARRRLGDLDALIADVPPEIRPKIARLPDPRPPPASAQEIALFCRYGRVAALDLPGMQAMLKQGIRSALGDDRAIVYGDRPWLVNLFQKRQFGSGNFYWEFREEQGPAFFADIRWVDHGYGEGVADLRRGDSELAKLLAERDRAGRFLRFYVWSDSFDVYLEARYLAEQKGWDVSWLAVDADDEVGVDLLGRSRRRVLLD